MAILFHSGITTNTDGNSKKVPDDVGAFTVQVDFATAVPTTATITLQGSLNNSTWLDLGSTTDVSAVTVGFSVADKPVKYIRANLTNYSAGSCTGVTILTEVGED